MQRNHLIAARKQLLMRLNTDTIALQKVQSVGDGHIPC